MRRREAARLRFRDPEPTRTPGNDRRPAPRWRVVAVAAGLFVAACADRTPPASGAPCAATGGWVEPGPGRTVGEKAVLEEAARARIVLLGEVHDDPAHHDWQLDLVSALHRQNRPLVIGVEALPRSAQAELDRWVAGELGEAEFLAATRWSETWGHDPKLYFPLFRFARDHRIPMLAMNVDRRLVSRVAREGWAGVPADERQGVGDPAPPAAAYRRSLTQAFSGHAEAVGRQDGAAAARLERFIEAQLTWDRAMAEAVAGAAAARPDATIVGIAGRGHVEHGWGIPDQLRDLGATPMVLLPVSADEACADAGLADAVFVLPARYPR